MDEKQMKEAGSRSPVQRRALGLQQGVWLFALTTTFPGLLVSVPFLVPPPQVCSGAELENGLDRVR